MVAEDIDGDGDIDFFAATDGIGSRGLLWFENLDGNGNFRAEPHTIDPVRFQPIDPEIQTMET